MGTYIFGTRNNIHIVDLAQTVPCCIRHCRRSATPWQRRPHPVRRHKRQAQDAIADAAKRSAQYYVNSRWLGGTLTNWKTSPARFRACASSTRCSLRGTPAATPRKSASLCSARARQARPLARRHQGYGRRTRPVVRDRHQQGRHREQGSAAAEDYGSPRWSTPTAIRTASPT